MANTITVFVVCCCLLIVCHYTLSFFFVSLVLGHWWCLQTAWFPVQYVELKQEGSSFQASPVTQRLGVSPRTPTRRATVSQGLHGSCNRSVSCDAVVRKQPLSPSPKFRATPQRSASTKLPIPLRKLPPITPPASPKPPSQSVPTLPPRYDPVPVLLALYCYFLSVLHAVTCLCWVCVQLVGADCKFCFPVQRLQLSWE